MGLKNYTLEQLQNIHGFKLLKFRDLSKLGLGKGDFVYIDALSNQVIMGSDEDGFPIEPEQDSDGTWHISGSLVVAPKPRLKKLLQQLTPLRDACGDATLVCFLPLGHFISGKCCRDKTHLENREDKDYGQIFVSAIASCQGCLEAAFPGCIIFNPTNSFLDAEGDMASLISSAGISIWQEEGPVHLTNAAYGDIAASLARVVTTALQPPNPLRTSWAAHCLSQSSPDLERQQLPILRLDGSLEKSSRENKAEAFLEGDLAVSAAPVAARQPTAAGEPAGYPTKRTTPVSPKQK